MREYGVCGSLTIKPALNELQITIRIPEAVYWGSGRLCFGLRECLELMPGFRGFRSSLGCN